MKYLNIGCGFNYSKMTEWTNVDFISTGEGVIAHNLLGGIPFENDGFDLVYHSHLLEHFSKVDGEKLIVECIRVLKPGGILRIAVPDLESITRKYLYYLEEVIQNPNSEINVLNYDWMVLEMYDQSVREYSGGNMAKYLFQDTIKNEHFIFERIGEEGRSLRRLFLMSKENGFTVKNTNSGIFIQGNLIKALKASIKKYILKKLKVDEKALEIGKFRLSGEVHKWMYDRYSLCKLLTSSGVYNIQVRDAFTSFVGNWADYSIDGKEGIVRKPDSLFMEAIK